MGNSWHSVWAPQLVIEHDDKWLVVPNQALYGDEQALLEYLE
ncbi:hypothetical protein [uncultured Moraxella sp.]|nr:hypothetical protein [uncultured Moraxella sp.]